MGRKASKPVKPSLVAICAAFAAGHKVTLTPKGPERERQPFSQRDYEVAISVMGGKRKGSSEAIDWMKARGLVDQRKPGFAYMLTAKGAHVTDRACSVFARRGLKPVPARARR